MDIATEHKDELFDAAVEADLVVLVEIDSRDVKVMLSETTDPRLAAKILRDIADSLDDDATALRAMPVQKHSLQIEGRVLVAPPGHYAIARYIEE